MALVMFVLGILFGLTVSFLTVLGTIVKGKLNDNRKSLKDKLGILETQLSVTERMEQVRKITDEQLDLLQAADHPQKNSLDGKYKNSLNKTVDGLQEEKVAILQSIIKDGFDPEISTQHPDGTVARMKLSEFMVESGILPSTKKEETKSKQLGKFVVHRGGKDDNGGTSH